MINAAARRRRRPVMLVILDGWGWRESSVDNAIRQAATPIFDRLWASCPHAFLTTHGRAVGLPDGQMGNSEVGHLNIGAGRVVTQDLPRIEAAIELGTLAQALALRRLITALRASRGTCHLMGLVSQGGVHAHRDHAAALATILHASGVPLVVHAFTDGRDVAPGSAAADLAWLAERVPIATVCGRYYAMDRDNRWDRVAQAYAAIVEADAKRVPTWPLALRGEQTDEFIVPTVVGSYIGMRDGDGVLCFNFRADRVRELMTALVDPGFSGFVRARPLRFAAAAAMTRYSDRLALQMPAIFPPQSMARLLGEVVAEAGLTQVRLAETEKYPHVTYFLNGGREQAFAGEVRMLVPSPKVATYDLQPEMSAPELTERAVSAISSEAHDLLVLNFANADMVGHTGKLEAAMAAVAAVDRGLGRVAQAIGERGGTLLVIADHGNAELMRDPNTGAPHTAHTTHPVPVILFGGPRGATLRDGQLADVAPTLLALLGLMQPDEMTGRSLLLAA